MVVGNSGAHVDFGLAGRKKMVRFVFREFCQNKQTTEKSNLRAETGGAMALAETR